MDGPAPWLFRLVLPRCCRVVSKTHSSTSSLPSWDSRAFCPRQIRTVRGKALPDLAPSCLGPSLPWAAPAGRSCPDEVELVGNPLCGDAGVGTPGSRVAFLGSLKQCQSG